MLRALFLTGCVLTCAAPMPDDSDEFGSPSDKVPELKVLARYVGAWEVEFTTKDLPFAKSKSTAKWVLDGRFVEQTGDILDKNGAVALRLKTLLTFDASKNAYRSWTFVSDGNTTESDGVWDEKAHTMTFIAKKREGESFSTTTADFSETGVENWKIVITDANGKASGEITGRNTRLKKAK